MCELRHEVLLAFQTAGYPPEFLQTTMTRTSRNPLTGLRSEKSQQVAIPIMTYKFNIRIEVPTTVNPDTGTPKLTEGGNRFNDFDVILRGLNTETQFADSDL